MEIFKYFNDVSDNPALYARKWKKEKGGRIIGTFCSYAPEEIILAAGALGFRIFGTSPDISKADAHLQTYSCSLVRHALDDALAGKLEFLDGTIFPHTCDSIQRLSDIWRINAKTGFHIDAIMPVKLNTKSAQAYMLDVLKKFKTDLENRLNLEIPNQDLKTAVDVCNRIRQTVNRIYEIRQKHPGIIQGGNLYAVVKAAMIMDRFEFLELLTELVQDIENKAGISNQTGPELFNSTKRLVLTGCICNTPDIHTIIENAGGTVVYDDLCIGTRYFGSHIDTQAGDIMDGIAEHYLQRIVCPAKHSGTKSRVESLIKIARQSRANGVIFIILKFCDPHSFDYPYITRILKQEKIPCMILEMEKHFSLDGQFKTRCEAFIEML